jgi:Sulfotransferase family
MRDAISRLEKNLEYRFRHLRADLRRPRLVVQTKPVLIEEANLCEQPIFLIGTGRSGTSLCRRIVDSHSRIACPPETHFLKYFAGMVRDPECFQGFDGLGYSTREEGLAVVRRWCSRYHEAYRLARGKARWADQTPQYVPILPELEAIFGPDARYVMIYRHPLDIAYSWLASRSLLGHYDEELLVDRARYVAGDIATQLAFSAEHPDRCFRLDYEVLVDRPEETLKRLFEFLGEPWEPEVLRFYEFDHNFGTEDYTVAGTRGFIRSQGNWRGLSEEQLRAILPILRPAIDALGYSAEISGAEEQHPVDAGQSPAQ